MKSTARLAVLWLLVLDGLGSGRGKKATEDSSGGGRSGIRLTNREGLIKSGRGRNFVSSANPALKMIAFDEDHNFNMLPEPEIPGEPVNVNISLNLRNVLQVNEISQLVTVEISIRMQWFHTQIRLTNESLATLKDDEEFLTLNPRLADHIWIPDIFIDQAKELREPTFYVMPASLRLYRNSMIRYAARVNFDVACNMDFRSYPGDTQTCDIKLESFGYTASQIVFRWMNNSNVNENISLAQFDLAVAMRNEYNTDYYDLPYPGLILTLTLRRKLSYHVVQTYIPSTIYLAVSWLALFVPPQSIAERLAMAMTIMLTLTAMFASERQSVPRVSYVTHLDVWMLTCVLFVFLELAEFTLVLHLSRTHKERLVPCIEGAAKILLPLIFFVFNAVYWYIVFADRHDLEFVDKGFVLKGA